MQVDRQEAPHANQPQPQRPVSVENRETRFTCIVFFLNEIYFIQYSITNLLKS